MSKRPRLALAIPTYNRPAELLDNMRKMLGELVTLGIPVFISDDGADNVTEQMIAELAREYPDISYRRNMPALGHDANILSVLCWPDADYVWVLGDALWIEPGYLGQVIEILIGQDLVFVNVRTDRTDTILARQNEQAHELIRELLWHQTMTGATIFGARVCDWARSRPAGFECLQNFPLLSVVLGYSSAHDVSIGWFGTRCIRAARKTSYWRPKAIRVFVDDWVSLVKAFPGIILPAHRKQVIKSHSAQEKLFGVETLVALKSSHELTWRSLLKPHFFDAMHLKKWQVVTILLLHSDVILFFNRLRFSMMLALNGIERKESGD